MKILPCESFLLMSLRSSDKPTSWVHIKLSSSRFHGRTGEGYKSIPYLKTGSRLGVTPMTRVLGRTNSKGVRDLHIKFAYINRQPSLKELDTHFHQ